MVDEFADGVSSKLRYRFSPCQGREFFDHFLLQRKKTLANLESDLIKNSHLFQENNIEFKYLDATFNDGRFSGSGLDLGLYHLNIINEDLYFDTKTILLAMLDKVTNNSFTLLPRYNNFLVHLCKEFNLFGKISIKYDSEFKPISNDATPIQTYALLSLLSLCLFESKQQYHFLDLALKINDAIQTHHQSDDELMQKFTSYLALKKELDVSRVIEEDQHANS